MENNENVDVATEDQVVVEQSNANVKEKEPGKGMAIAALILGIVSVLCCSCFGLFIITSIVGIVLAILALRKGGSFKTMAIVALVLCIVALILNIYMIVCVGVAMVEVMPYMDKIDWDKLMKMTNQSERQDYLNSIINQYGH